jgi:membrane-associated phospholipid phosphatase
MERRARRFLVLIPLLIAGVATGGNASAQQVVDPSPPPARAPAYPHLRWNDNWPRFSLAEAMISAAVTFRNADLGAALTGPTSATISFEVPVLDPGSRDLLRASDASRRKGAARISDMGFRSLVLAPYALDVGLGALALHRNLDVAAQLALIDFEVLTLAGFTQLLGSRILGRARPYTSECPPEGCTGGPYRSFLSGHTMASFTGAGLICVHHKFLPLFGGGATDTWACVWAVTAASLTGTMRLVADEHWASDVLIGAGMGWLFGYYLPQLLHFHVKNVTTKAGSGRGITWMPTLTGTPESGAVGVLGTF